jgi:hypothetical protein
VPAPSAEGGEGGLDSCILLVKLLLYLWDLLGQRDRSVRRAELPLQPGRCCPSAHQRCISHPCRRPLGWRMECRRDRSDLTHHQHTLHALVAAGCRAVAARGRVCGLERAAAASAVHPDWCDPGLVCLQTGVGGYQRVHGCMADVEVESFRLPATRAADDRVLDPLQL